MALTTWQKDRARYDGGKDVANRKRQLAQLKTMLVNLGNDIDAGRDGLEGALSSKDLETIKKAALLVSQVENRLKRDANEAKHIKAAYETRYAAARNELKHLPHTAIDDAIALIGVAASPSEIDNYVTKEITGQRWRYALSDQVAYALGALAHRAARAETPPALMCCNVMALYPANKSKYADLIANLTALAVEAQLRKSA